MKNIKYIAWSGVALLLIALSFTACTDGNDWEVDSAYDRLFSVTKLSITASETDAEVSWSTSPNTEYYIIEISTDSLYDAIGLGETAGSRIFGEDKSITGSEYEMEDLDGSTKYYFRIRAMSSTKKPSNWAYLDNYYFTTKSEQIVRRVLVTSDTTAELYWTPGVVIDRIELLKGETFVKDLKLTSEALAEGFIEIDGLEAATTYTVNLYRGDNKRGDAGFQTAPSIPAADYTLALAANDSLNQTVFDDLALAGYQNVTITLPANASYYNANKIYLPDGMSLTFFGLAGGDKPVIAVQMFEFGDVHAFIKFQNVELTGYGKDANGENKQNDYIFNQSNETNVTTLEFEDCLINGFKNTPVRLQAAVTKTIRNLVVNDCIIKGASSRTYSIVHVDAGGAGKIENISFTNSTIWYSGKSFIYSKDTEVTSILVESCTFSKVPGAADYLIDFGSTDIGATDYISVKNVILGSIGGATAKGIRAKGTPNISNTFKTTDWETNGNHISGLIEYNGSEADLFVNPEEGDFTIKDTSFEGRNDAGDPRWR